jgi:hypothetical protein
MHEVPRLCTKYQVQGTKYNVPSTRYEVDSEACGRQARAEIQETRLTTLCYEIRMVYEFSLHHSSFGVRHSTLKKSIK